LSFLPDITHIFTFSRPGAFIASISENGTSLPKLYLTSDLRRVREGNGTASPILKINGQDAPAYLENLSSNVTYHDADARYNRVFANPALAAIDKDSTGILFTYYVYPGPNTTYTFENGSDFQLGNVASIPPSYDFSQVFDGASFFEAFCSGPNKVPKIDSGSPTAPPTIEPSPIASEAPSPIPSLLG
jgi:hypothetical protein